MLSCRQLSEHATELIEKRASWQQRMSARIHMIICQHCRRYLHQLRLTATMVRRLRRPHPPVDPARVLAAIANASRE